MKKFDLNETEQTLVSNILGYLNFSSGSFNVQFVQAWNELYKSLSQKGSNELWRDSLDTLKARLLELETLGGAFSDAKQAQKILEIIDKTLIAYREFHSDVLFTPKNDYLFNSFFMARVCRIISSQESLRTDEKAIEHIVNQLNDFLGYRPIPTLEGGEKHEPNAHEWIAPLPLYYEGAGVAFGQYQKVIELTLEILKTTDPDILREASFIPEKLRELAVDPRAYDFDHPVNSRLNYSFGTWDDRCIDKDGYFRRFIVHRTMLDAIMGRVWSEDNPVRHSEYEYEAAAVLAGTMLMASGTCGGHVQAHDSTVTLGSLTPMIASYRDRFYESLLKKAPLPLKKRLEEEATRLFQPFAGARQFLNQNVARKRADQLQRFALARTYARMGYFEASKRQTSVIETTASRLLSEIDCYITKAHLAADSGKLSEAAACLPPIESLLHRGLDCGAFPDPWFILGFDSQFNLFPSVENGVHDHRIDGLIDLLNDIFDLYSRLQKEAAAQGNSELRLELSDQMSNLADWWDQFGSTEVSSVEGFSGQEVWESAAEVSRALAVWNQAGKAIGDVAFWKRHVERFKTPKAFVLLCEALLDKNDLVSSSSLLIYWLNQSETIPLVEGDYSFHSIVFDWMEQAWRSSDEISKPTALRRKATNRSNIDWTLEDYSQRWKMTTKFLDYFGVNADSYWSIPKIDLPSENFARKLEFKTDNPILAELARRMILETRLVGQTSSGRPRILLKASFRDAARAIDSSNLPSPNELKIFYQNNQKVFPKYLTFSVFMQVLQSQIHMTSEQLSEYRNAFLSQGFDTISVSDPNFDSNLSADDANQQAQKRLWNAMVNELGKDNDVVNVKDLIDQILDKEQSSIQLSSNTQDISKLSEALTKASINIVEDFSDEFDEPSEEFSEEDSNASDTPITGGDPTFSAAYENMSFRDTADDGIDDETAEGKSSFDGHSENHEFARETDRISERLTFIFSTVKLWKFASGRSPLLVSLNNATFDDAVYEDARLRLEAWRDQALQFAQELDNLLDQTSRFRVPRPSGTADSLAEYDQIRGTKEILLDRIIWTLVEVEDVIVFLKATLRDETSDKYAKPWKSIALETFSAIFRRDVKRVRFLWPKLLEYFERETLLYIPTARGGDARAIVECRRLQQVVLSLLKYAPRLGLLCETFQLISCVQTMEQNRLSSPGSITEYDRLVETAARSITETLAESSKTWKLSARELNTMTSDDVLVDYLISTTDVILKSWLSHSQQIRISSVEAILTAPRWEAIKRFIQEYGADLFTQEFLAFRNIRAILHQGAGVFLSTLISMKKEEQELEVGDKLVTAIIEGQIDLGNASTMLEIILECVAEDYTEYIGYNSTTTQSDNGSKLYTLLDFLRVLSSYERISWNLKPVYWTHDSLIRSERPIAAAIWKDWVRQKSSGLADNGLKEYANLNKRYGIWLPSIYERLRERFIRPLDIAQMCGLVFDAISEVRKSGEENSIFFELSREIEDFAETPAGVGFELPEWLTELQDEVVLSRVDSKEERRERDPKEDPFESIPFLPIEKMTRTYVDEQLDLALANIRRAESDKTRQ